MNRAFKIIIIFIFTYFTMMLLCLNANLADMVFGSKSFLIEINQILNSFDISHVIIGFMIYYFYYNTYFIDEQFTKKKIYISIVSIILSILLLIGKYLQVTKTFPNFSIGSTIFICLLTFIGAYLAFYAIIKKITSIDFSINLNIKKKKKIDDKKKAKFKLVVKKISEYIKKHPILSIFILILLCRIPYLIIYYPGNATGDTFDQLCQIFNRKALWTKNYVNMVNNNVFLNNHHPIFSTLFLGFFVKVGWLIKSRSIGLFLYTIFLTIFTSLVFSVVINYIKKLGISKIIYILSIIFICLNPLVSSHVITIIKDTPEAIFTLIYVVLLLQIVRKYKSIFNKKNRVVLLVLTMLLMMLFRHNGIITILFSYPLLLILYKRHYKKLLIVLLIPFIIYFSFNKVMYNYFDVSKGSKTEMMSVPFMQVARVANKKGENAINKSDQKVINRVINYSKLKDNYLPDVADNVKSQYRKNATNHELIEFFIVWAKYLKKYPSIYAASFINSTYQYFYPYDVFDNLYLGFDVRIMKEFPEFKSINNTTQLKLNINTLMQILFNSPIIGILFRVAFYDWVLIISSWYVLYKKKYKYIIPLMPLIAVLLVTLAGPVNGCMRYILPILFSFPVILTIDYLVYKESK